MNRARKCSTVCGVSAISGTKTNALLPLTDTLRHRNLHFYGPDDPIFGWFTQDGEVTGACLQTPPHPLLLIGMPLDTVPPLAKQLSGRPLPGVNGRT